MSSLSWADALVGFVFTAIGGLIIFVFFTIPIREELLANGEIVCRMMGIFFGLALMFAGILIMEDSPIGWGIKDRITIWREKQ